MPYKKYSDMTCAETGFPGAGPGKEGMPVKVWSLSFKPDQGLSVLFPYINAIVDDALWYEEPEHVRCIVHGHRCILYPYLASAHFFETRASAEDFIGPMMAFFNRLEQTKGEVEPNYSRIPHVRVLDVLKLLPGSNCGDCGFPACMAFAAAVARGRAVSGLCPSLVRPVRESAEYPMTDIQGNWVQSIALPMDTTVLRQKIRMQEKKISDLKTRLEKLDRIKTINEERPQDPRPVAVQAGQSFPENQYRPFSTLTDREVQVLDLIAQGHTNIEIGGMLQISPHTVKSHMINIFNKFGVSDRTKAAVHGVRAGLI